MRGVVFTGDRQLELMTFPDPTPRMVSSPKNWSDWRVAGMLA